MNGRNLVWGFGVGVAVGAGGCYIYLSAIKRPEPRHGGMGPGMEATEHSARRFGLPETEVVRQYSGYIASYDFRTRNPKWVVEHLTADSANGSANRDNSDFFPDPGVDPRFSAKLADFRGSGYDRGHMAPAADHKCSQQAMDETFSLVNISPQVGAGFNRDYWARFEKFVKDLTRVASDVYVVTGPLWLPTLEQQQQQQGAAAGGRWTTTHGWIGQPPGLVAVPTHYYKVVVADPRGGGDKERDGAVQRRGIPGDAVAVGAFVLPNQAIDPKVPLSAYTVALDDLEQVAGARFFPELMGDARRRAALDTAASGWRQQGQAALKPFDRVTMKQAYAALPASTTATATAAVVDVEATPASVSLALASQPAAEALPSAAAPTASPRPPAPPPPTPKTPRGTGVVHLCDVNACRLPSPDFYLRGSTGGNGGSGGNKGGSSRRGRG